MKEDQPSDLGYASAAWFLLCEERALRAVATVESGPQGAFDEQGRPTILYERTKFSRLTEKRHDSQGYTVSKEPWGWISDPHHAKGEYGPLSAQYEKLELASTLDRDAANKSCSWGLYQIMGYHHAVCGYDTVQRFVNAMFRSADDHLRALTMFLRADSGLVDAIRARDWLKFALRYNGPAQAGYDKKIGVAYDQLG